MQDPTLSDIDFTKMKWLRSGLPLKALHQVARFCSLLTKAFLVGAFRYYIFRGEVPPLLYFIFTKLGAFQIQKSGRESRLISVYALYQINIVFKACRPHYATAMSQDIELLVQLLGLEPDNLDELYANLQNSSQKPPKNLNNFHSEILNLTE